MVNGPVGTSRRRLGPAPLATSALIAANETKGEIAMPEYTDLQVAVLTMPKEDLNEAAGIVTDWAGRVLDRCLEDPESPENRRYDMPKELRAHLEAVGGLRERVSDLLDAIDDFAGYFPMDGGVKDADFLVEFYESEAFANAPKVSFPVGADPVDAAIDSARVIHEWAARMLMVKDDLPAGIVASLQSLLSLNFWVRGLVETLELAISPSAHDGPLVAAPLPDPLAVYLVTDGIPKRIPGVYQFVINVVNPSREGGYAPEMDINVDYDPSNPEHRALLAAGGGGIVTVRVAILDANGTAIDCREMECTVERYHVFWGARLYDLTKRLRGDFDLEVVGETRVVCRP